MSVELLAVWVDGPLDERLPENTARQIDWPRGTVGFIDVQLVDARAKPFDLDIDGDDELRLVVRRNTSDGPVFTRYAAKTEFGWYRFSIAEADTFDIEGFFVYDVWASHDGIERQVVGLSYFNVSMRIQP